MTAKVMVIEVAMDMERVVADIDDNDGRGGMIAEMMTDNDDG